MRLFSGEVNANAGSDDVLKELGKARASISVASGRGELYRRLTVRESLEYSARLRGS